MPQEFWKGAVFVSNFLDASRDPGHVVGQSLLDVDTEGPRREGNEQGYACLSEAGIS